MRRKGFPNQWQLELAGGARWILAVAFLFSILCVQLFPLRSCCAQNGVLQVTPLDQLPLKSKLQFTWQSIHPQGWDIAITVSENSDSQTSKLDADNHPSLSQIINLCEDDDSTGAYTISPDGKSIRIRNESQTDQGQCQFTFQGTRATKINVTMRAVEGGGQESGKTLAMQDILSQPVVSKLEGSAAEWSIGRVADDVIRLEVGDSQVANRATNPTNEDWRFLRTNQEFPLNVRAESLIQAVSEPVLMIYELHRVRDREMVAAEQATVTLSPGGSCGPIRLAEKAPAEEGVYEIRCRFYRDEHENLISRIRGKRTLLAETRKPLVVFSDDVGKARRRRVSDSQWRVLTTINPTEKSDWQDIEWWTQSASRLLPNNQIPNSEPLPIRKYADGKVAEIMSGKRFVSRIPVDKVSCPHKLVLTFPSDQAIDPSSPVYIELSSDLEFRTQVQRFILSRGSGFSSGTPGKFQPIQSSNGQWQSATIFYYPESNDQFIRIYGQENGDSVRIRSVAVSAGPWRLTEEDSAPNPPKPAKDSQRTAALKLPSMSWPAIYASDVKAPGFSEDTLAWHRILIAVDRVADYAEYAGFNALIIPILQRGRVWFPSSVIYPKRLNHRDDAFRTECLLRKLNGRSIDLYAHFDMELAFPATRPSNHLNPLVQAETQRIFADAIAQLQEHESFSGAVVSIDGKSCLREINASAANDQETLLQFAEQTGSSRSLAELRGWVQTQGKSELQGWLNASSAKFVASLARQLPDNQSLILDGKPSWYGIFPQDQNGMKDLDRVIATVDRRQGPMRNWNSDLTREAGDAGNVPKRTANGEIANRHRAKRSRNSRNVQLVSAEETVSSGSERGRPTAVRLGAIIPGETDRVLQQSESLSSDISNAVRFFDARMIVVDGHPSQVADLSSYHDQSRNSLLQFRQLPRQGLRTIPSQLPKRETVQLRYGVLEGNVVLWMTNLAPWSSTVVAELSGPYQFQNGEDPEEPVKGGLFQKSLEPYQTVVLTAATLPGDSRQSSRPIRRWHCQTKKEDMDTESVKRHVATVVGMVGRLGQPEDYPVLANGGFEKIGEVGVPGWMHTQHPSDAVSVDSVEAFEGKRSVRLSSKAEDFGRTWIISENIAPPSTGRLAVSFAVRGELTNESGDLETKPRDPANRSVTQSGGRKTRLADHQLRVSLEANRGGEPIRYSSEFTVPRNGQWQPRRIVLEATGVGRDEVDSLRLTIDSLSTGKIWIDDVHLHDHFPLKSERSDLQNAVFLAMQGLHSKDLTHATRLLQNVWARELLRLAQEESTAAKRQDTHHHSATEPTSVADRIKNWIPKPLRF